MAAQLSACFIRDFAAALEGLPSALDVRLRQGANVSAVLDASTRARSILLDRSRALETIEFTNQNPLTLIQCERIVL